MMVAVNHWLSGASPDVRGRWSSQRPSEPPTLTLDAFEQDAGFAALAWTRATSRCITDYQGNVHEIPASAKPRNGVRVVQNLAQGSEGAAGIGSYVDGCAIASTTDYLADPASTLWKATENSATGVHMFEWVTLSWVSGVKYTVSIYVRENGRSFLWLSFAGIAGFSACYDLNAGSVGSVGADTTAGIERHGDLYRCWLTFEATYTGSTAMRAYLRTTDGLSSETYAGDGSSGIYVTAAQCQRARPGQSEPDEYVSNGVLATPYHDGIGVDGLKYFATDENGALITGTRGYDRDETGAWVVSSDVDPIVPSIPVGVAQTNRITHPSALGSWSTSGSPTVTVGYDAQVGTYARITVSAADSVYLAASGFTGSARTETALMMRMVSTSGTLRMSNVEGTANGDIDLVAASISTTRFERVDRFHAAATVNTEFSATAGGAAGVTFDTESGSITVDVARVAQVQGERVHEIPLEATAVSTINADVPYFGAISAYATNNAGAVVFDFTPKAQTALQAYYLSDLLLCYKNSATDLITQYDGTTSASFGSQTEGTRTKIATSWQTGVGRYGYRDGVSKFAATAYDGAWASANQSFTGPMEIHRYLMHRTAEATTYLQGATA